MATAATKALPAFPTLPALKEKEMMLLFVFAWLVSGCLFRFAFEQVEETPERVMCVPAVRIRADIGFNLSRLRQFFRILRGIGWFRIIGPDIVSRSNLRFAVLGKADGVHQFVVSDRWI